MKATNDVITLLKVYVFKEVSADGSGRNGIPVHVDSRQMWNHTFHRHQALMQIFIDGRSTVGHKGNFACSRGDWCGGGAGLQRTAAREGLGSRCGRHTPSLIRKNPGRDC